MCGRFTLTHGLNDEALRRLGLPTDAGLDRLAPPRFNIAPRQEHVIVRMQREDRELIPARWGLVNGWARDDRRAARQINARAEILSTSWAYREAFRARRCVVPADGFYEWTGPRADRRPIWYHRPDGGLLFLAGLYEAWHPEPVRREVTFTIITTGANADVAPVHDRMPVILPESVLDDWMFAAITDTERLTRMLAPAADNVLVGAPVSSRVNSVKNDDPACLEPEAEGDEVAVQQPPLILAE